MVHVVNNIDAGALHVGVKALLLVDPGITSVGCASARPESAVTHAFA